MILQKFIAISILSLVFFNQVFAISAQKLEPLPSHRDSTILITKIIEQNHYKDVRLNDEQSGKIFDEYLETLDPGRTTFTQDDIDQFSQYRLKLDDALSKGDLSPAFSMFQRFNDRRIERANYALKLLDKPFDFSIKESYQFNREDIAWAKDEKELNEIWRKRVKNDFLTLMLEDKKEEELKETLRKRYNRIIKRTNQFKAEDAYEFFINSYLRTVEPHTAYFSPRTSENFNINMSLSLEGIGAVLQTIDEHTVVRRVIKGGPADLSGGLHAGDKIIGVGQGVDKVEDVIGWRLDDVVDKIRGPKDSIVQLQILPKASGAGGSAKYLSITRNKIKLEDQQVQKSTLEIPDGKQTKKIGVIEIPTFYMDFAASARGEKDFSSTTRDTRIIIEELKSENVDGIVVDLRRNGGGSLIEAVALTGLFIESGPVVQIRNSDGSINVDKDEDSSIAYSGPLAVLVDRNSASASEIFAGAIQDYGRGTVVGEPTFGKGTVQTIIDLNRFVKGGAKLGQLKLTLAQFFRVNGDSTQHRGVIPDIIFPTADDSDDHGERALDNALPWANIKAAAFQPSGQIPPDIKQVKTLHQSRIKKDNGFDLLLSQAERRDKLLDKKAISLLMSERKAEREKQKIEQNDQLNKFRVSRGMETATIDEDFSSNEDSDPDENKDLSDKIQEILLRESASILVDINKTVSKSRVTQQVGAKQSGSHL